MVSCSNQHDHYLDFDKLCFFVKPCCTVGRLILQAVLKRKRKSSIRAQPSLCHGVYVAKATRPAALREGRRHRKMSDLSSYEANWVWYTPLTFPKLITSPGLPSNYSDPCVSYGPGTAALTLLCSAHSQPLSLSLTHIRASADARCQQSIQMACAHWGQRLITRTHFYITVFLWLSRCTHPSFKLSSYLT